MTPAVHSGASAELIAGVVRDLRRGRYVTPAGRRPEPLDGFKDSGPTVDATAMYEQVTHTSITVNEDFEIHPVWEKATIGYVNEHGNAMIQACRIEWPDSPTWTEWESNVLDDDGEVAFTQDVDWSDVIFTLHMLTFAGGRSGAGAPIPTCGPLYWHSAAVASDHTVADLAYRDLRPDQQPARLFQNSAFVPLQTYTLAGCVNVDIAEPERPRAERRRLARTGVTVHTIQITPTSTSTRSTKGSPTNDTPQHFVRGHFARYGPEYGRGLLFGKHAGRFWVPSHARGSVEAESTREIDYRVTSA